MLFDDTIFAPLCFWLLHIGALLALHEHDSLHCYHPNSRPLRYRGQNEAKQFYQSSPITSACIFTSRAFLATQPTSMRSNPYQIKQYQCKKNVWISAVGSRTFRLESTVVNTCRGTIILRDQFYGCMARKKGRRHSLAISNRAHSCLLDHSLTC